MKKPFYRHCVLILLAATVAAFPLAAGGAMEDYAGDSARSTDESRAADEQEPNASRAAGSRAGETADTLPDDPSATAESEGGVASATRVAPIAHSPTAMRSYERALRAYLKRDFERAEEYGKEALDVNPNCIEVKWLMACIFEKTGDLGRLLEYAGDLGIREARESAYISGLVQKGSRGYVLSRRDDYATVDLTEADGAREGLRLVAYEEGDILRHPVTLEIVDVDQPERGTLQIVQTYDTHSIARVLQGHAAVRRGMRVISEENYDRFSFEGDQQTASLEREDTGPRYKAIRLSQSYDGSELSGPEGFFFDSDNNLFVADTGNDRIVKLSAAGRFIDAFGESGSGQREFRGPVSIAVVGEDLAVVERMNHRVHLVDPENMRHEGVVGSRGIGAPGRFTTPQKAVSKDGMLYVLDSGNRRVQVIDKEGNVQQDTVTDAEVDQIPVSFTLLSDQIVLLDAVEGIAHRFSAAAPYRYQEASRLPDELRDVSIVDVTAFRSDGTEYLAFVLDQDSKIVITDAATLTVVQSIGTAGSGTGEFNQPVQAVVIDGALHVLERGNLRIQVISDFL